MLISRIPSRSIHLNFFSEDLKSGKDRMAQKPRVHRIPVLVESKYDSWGYSSGSQCEKRNPVNMKTKEVNNPKQSQDTHHESKRRMSIPVFVPRTRPESHPKKLASQTPSSFPPSVNYKPKEMNNINLPRGTLYQSDNVRLQEPADFAQMIRQPPPSSPPTENGVPQPKECGAFITNVRPNMPVTVESKEAHLNEVKPREDTITNPKQQIDDICNETNKLKEEIKMFNGCTNEKQYANIEKMLDRLILKLLDVNTGGKDDIRQRWQAFRDIAGCISLFDPRISDDINPEQGSPECEGGSKAHLEDVLDEMEKNSASQPQSSPSPPSSSIPRPGSFATQLRETLIVENKPDQISPEKSNDSTEPNVLVTAEQDVKDNNLKTLGKLRIVDDLLSKLGKLSNQVEAVTVAGFTQQCGNTFLREIQYCTENLLVLRNCLLPCNSANSLHTEQLLQLQSNLPESPTTSVEKQADDSLEDDKIENVLALLEGIKRQVQYFSGRFGNKQYKYLEQRLNMCISELDDVDAGGRDDIRERRRSAAQEVESTISVLRSKVLH